MTDAERQEFDQLKRDVARLASALLWMMHAKDERIDKKTIMNIQDRWIGAYDADSDEEDYLRPTPDRPTP